MGKNKIKPIEEALLTSFLGEHDERKAIDKAIQDGNVLEIDDLVGHATKIQRLSAQGGTKNELDFETCLKVAHLMRRQENQDAEITKVFVLSYSEENHDETYLHITVGENAYSVVGPEALEHLKNECAEELADDLHNKKLNEIDLATMILGIPEDETEYLFECFYEMARGDWEETSDDDEIFHDMSYDEQLDYAKGLVKGMSIEDFARQFGEYRVKAIIAQVFSPTYCAHVLVHTKPEVLNEYMNEACRRIELPGGFYAF